MNSEDTITLFQSVRELIEGSRRHVVRNVNTIMLYTNFTIGKMIVEEEQKGKNRAGYAESILKDLSAALLVEYGKGFSHRNLDHFKKFYLLYQKRFSQTLSAKSDDAAGKDAAKNLMGLFAAHFKISWSHYVLLMKIQGNEEREYYESEAAAGNWSLRELQRQYDSSLYERLALSAN